MDIIKYFYEEPASLEALSPDLDPDARRSDGPTMSLEALLNTPRYNRGYLAGTDLATRRIGLTSIAHPAAFVRPLLDSFANLHWLRGTAETTEAVPKGSALAVTLRDPNESMVLVGAKVPLPVLDLSAVIGTGRRHGIAALRTLLDTAQVVCFPEPAHHGFDWSFFSAQPLRAMLVAAFRKYPHEGVRRFVIPFQRARSEERFYFESWQLEQDLPTYIEEV